MTLDRTGEPVEPACRDPRCGNGCPKRWLGYDNDGRPIPCLRCKPHLIRIPSVRDLLDDQHHPKE